MRRHLWDRIYAMAGEGATLEELAGALDSGANRTDL